MIHTCDHTTFVVVYSSYDHSACPVCEQKNVCEGGECDRVETALGERDVWKDMVEKAREILSVDTTESKVKLLLPKKTNEAGNH